MNTIQIEWILRRDPSCKKSFKGVYAQDKIKRISYPSAYVINSDPSTRPGKHWIAVFFDRRGNGEYTLIVTVYLQKFLDLLSL